MNDTITRRKHRWTEFLKPGAEAGLRLIVDSPSFGPERPLLWPSKWRERIDWAMKDFERRVEQMSWLHDDAVPFLSLSSGTEIFAEAFGCSVFRPDTDMPCARPLVHNAAEAARLKTPELSRSTLTYLFDMADELKERGGEEVPLRLVDIQSPMGITALLWDKNDFYTALLQQPEAVRELAEKVKELLFAFLDEWFGRYGQDFISHCPDCYMPFGVTLSEDEIGAVGTETFEAMFLPDLVELSGRYGRIGMHCCANARHQWPGLGRVPNLAYLNLVQPNDVLNDACEYFKDTTVQYHHWHLVGPPKSWPGHLPKEARVVIHASVETRDEAIQTVDALHGVLGIVED